VAPSAADPGTLWALGEFFADPVFLKAGENVRSWVAFSPSVSTSLLTRGAPITVTIPDTLPPQVTSFVLPGGNVTHTNNQVAVSISGQDNVPGAAVLYAVTESATPPAADALVWSATSSFNYTFQTPFAAITDPAKTLYAWAKDTSTPANVSNLFATTRSVTFNNLPAISSFTGPTSVVLAPTATVSSVPVQFTINAESYDAAGLVDYCVSASQDVASCTWQPWGTTNSQNVTFTYTGPVTAARTTVPLFAWVGDGIGDSARRQASFAVSSAPQVTTFTVTAPPAASKVITVNSLVGQAAAPATVVQYKITESATPPLATDTGWVAYPPATPITYTYQGTVPAGTTSKHIYAWVIDSNDVVSVSSSVTGKTVRFTNMP
jgi:hypothetical protein